MVCPPQPTKTAYTNTRQSLQSMEWNENNVEQNVKCFINGWNIAVYTRHCSLKRIGKSTFQNRIWDNVCEQVPTVLFQSAVGFQPIFLTNKFSCFTFLFLFLSAILFSCFIIHFIFRGFIENIWLCDKLIAIWLNNLFTLV